jgi:hypothetical protein
MGVLGTGRLRLLATAVAAALVATALAFVGVSSPAQAAFTSTTGSIKLNVLPGEASFNPAVPAPKYPAKYRWLINKEDVGDPTSDMTTTAGRANLAKCLPPSNNGLWPSPNPIATYAANAPEDCPWPSIRNTPGYVPILTQGTDADLNATTALEGIPNGKYLISVLANGYKIGGAHFTVNSDDSAVTVKLDPNPTPLGTIRIHVFNDYAPVDSTYEAGAEDPQPNDTQGMSGFTAHLGDVLGAVTTDWFNNPLCTVYEKNPDGSIKLDLDGAPVIDTTKPARCVSDRNGDIVIPNMGPNRYASTVVAPQLSGGNRWIQTTTLEGSQDHDIWIMENNTGFDTEVTVGGEAVPWVHFGFTKKPAQDFGGTPGSGTVKGQVMAGLSYIGGQGGQAVPGEPGTTGAAYKGPVDRPWITLSDLGAGDQEVYMVRGNTDGTFSIPNVPAGSYQLTMWDEPIDYLLFSMNVTVKGSETVDVGQQIILGWFTDVDGYVFVDSNGNGKKDAGEAGVPRTTVTVRERVNSLMDQGQALTTTDANGYYHLARVYPLTKWLILEHFNTLYEGTGVTVQGYNDAEPQTFLGASVDMNFLPVIGLGGHVDWGVKPYDQGTNGGIVGTVSYDVTRNEFDPSVSAAEDYQPSIPGIGVQLHATVACDPATYASADGTSCNTDGYVVEPNGALRKGPELADTYTSETWQPPHGCTAKDWRGQPLSPPQQYALPAFGNTVDTGGTDAGKQCVEAPMMGFQARPEDATPGAWGQQVNGNYGFGASKRNQYDPTSPDFDPNDPNVPAPGGTPLDLWAPLHCLANPTPDQPARMSDCPANSDYDFDDQPLLPADYIVSVDVPNDYRGKPLYTPTREEDVNVFDGDTHLPQENYPLAAGDYDGQATPPGSQSNQNGGEPPAQGNGPVVPCAGPLHVVDVKGVDGLDENGATVPDNPALAVDNPNFAAGGGSPYEGKKKPLCSDKLVTLRDQSSVAPTFFLFTEVPQPTHFWGLTINDLGLTLDKRSAAYGEAQGIANVPTGIYDWKGELVDTVNTDYNGYYEAIEPSTGTYNCPLPAGPCPGMYYFVGNDPGTLAHPNANYNPRFRTIGTNFQAWPGLFTVTDTAPTQVASTILLPGATTPVQPNCNVATDAPDLFSVDKPWVRLAGSNAQRTVTVKGVNFGAGGSVILTNQAGGSATTQLQSWSDTQVSFRMNPNSGSGSTTPGVYTLEIRRANGQRTRNDFTIHLLGGNTNGNAANSYLPAVFEVNGPNGTANATNNNPRIRQSTTIQAAINASAAFKGSNNNPTTPLVVVYPNTQPTAWPNPHRAYYENVILNTRAKLQGTGPGGFQGTTFVPGSEINGLNFDPDAAAWYDTLTSRPYDGIPEVADGATVTVVAQNGDFDRIGTGTGNATVRRVVLRPSIDGFTITGGTQQGAPGAANGVTGAVNTTFGAPGARITQGGGIYVHAYARTLQITDNVIAGNSGSYAGGIRVGTPYVGTDDNQNDDVVIARNAIRDNGGMNLAGGVGIFSGADNYVVDSNVLCGNFSAEYGGALTQYGRKNGTGTINNNDIYYNTSYDEGGGVMLAGELPADPNALSTGTGPVNVTGNDLSLNVANDDGGGLRLLQVGNFPVHIENNTIADNVSAHEGGGVAIDDAPAVVFQHNTVMKNITTATAVTSNGQPAPAGLSTAANSDALQATLGSGAALWSNPTLRGNIFWDNRAGRFESATGLVRGIGDPNDPTPTVINNWDMGAADGSGLLSPVNSVLQVTTGTNVSVSNRSTDPQVRNPSTIAVNVLALRTNPAFRQALIVTPNLPLTKAYDYHLSGTSSPAVRLVPWPPFFISGPAGTAASGNNMVPLLDIDGQLRPITLPSNAIDAGSDELS